MRAAILTIIFSFVIINCVLGQQINYATSFEQAQSIASKKKKPMAILLTIKIPENVRFNQDGLKDKEVVEIFNSNFINFKADMSDTTINKEIIEKYKVSRFPSFIFIDAQNGLIAQENALLSNAESLLKITKKAILISKEKSIHTYDQIYNSGKVDKVFLKNYILRRQLSGLTNNDALIEKYIMDLKVSEINTYDEILFILKAGPVVDGSAFKIINFNKQLVDSIFKTESVAEQAAINNVIIKNSMNSAIANKNHTRAFETASYAAKTWKNNFIERQKTHHLKMIQYYRGINDTTNYLTNASLFYENYYMRISVDSIKKLDSINYIKAKNNAKLISIAQTNDSTTKKSFSFSYVKDSYATDLNNVAWNYTKMAINKNEHLVKAMLWARRAIELSPKPQFYDTYAHLLYLLKFFNEAENMQNLAITLAKKDYLETVEMEKALAKIKKRTL